MLDEPAPPRRQRGAALAEALREDLDSYGVEELEERIETLEREAGRTRSALERKRATRAAADSIFSFRPSPN
jgi:uncharacterized small protein (DUF1192 family)